MITPTFGTLKFTAEEQEALAVRIAERIEEGMDPAHLVSEILNVIRRPATVSQLVRKGRETL